MGTLVWWITGFRIFYLEENSIWNSCFVSVCSFFLLVFVVYWGKLVLSTCKTIVLVRYLFYCHYQCILMPIITICF